MKHATISTCIPATLSPGHIEDIKTSIPPPCPQLHGRSREQRYTKFADWQYIKECATQAAPLPLFGNGDVLNYEDYVAKKAEAGVAGKMLTTFYLPF